MKLGYCLSTKVQTAMAATTRVHSTTPVDIAPESATPIRTLYALHKSRIVVRVSSTVLIIVALVLEGVSGAPTGGTVLVRNLCLL
jgi:hypothetical protein